MTRKEPRTAILRFIGPALFAASAFAACSDSGAAAQASGAGVDAAPDRGNGGKPNTDIIVFDSAGGTLSEPDVGPPDAGEQPVVACSADAGSNGGAADSGTSTECEPPPSRCADSRVLVYYREGTCVDGRCRWREESYQCKLSCAGSGCNDNFTAPAAN
jgi:hypothetical protein